jgi:uncharacterized membrane protein (DUF4010 family)
VSSGLAVALGAGLLVGLERERRKGQGDDRGAAGLRTFMVAALAGAVGYSLFIWLAVVVLFGVALMAALSYWRSRSSDPGLTTELALVAMTLIGMLAMTQPALAAACAVVLAAVLAARERLHRFATDWLSEDELHDGLLLAALALVLLPLLPTEPVIWLGGLSWHRVLLLVVMILLLQAGSHLGQRLLGPHLGLPVTGLLGGFVSSTATVGAVGAQVRAGQVPWRLALCAAVLSTAATWVQVGMMASVVAPALLTGWLPLLATGAAVPLVTGGGLWLLARRHARLESQLQVPSDGATSAPDQKRGRVLRPREALMVTVLLLGGAVLVQWARQAGQEGLVAGVAVAALADAHAPVVAVLSLQGSGELTWRLAVLSVLTAITVNSLTRMVVGVVAGGRRFGVMLGGAMLLNLLVVWGWWGVWG